MSESGQFPTRQSVIIHHTQLMLAQTNCSLIDFVKQLTLNYLSVVPDHARSLSFRQWKDRSEKERDNVLDANRKLVQRYLDGTVHFPAELEEAWVMTLPDGHREKCVFDLLFRYGQVPVPILQNVSLSELSVMMREHAEALEALAPMFSDGHLNEKDAPFALDAYQELMESMSATAAMAQYIRDAFPKLIQQAPVLQAVG